MELKVSENNTYYLVMGKECWLNSTSFYFIFKIHYIQKTKIVASSPITSWQVDGETVKTVADFIFLVSKITADGDCSHEIKFPWKEIYNQPR